MKIPSFFRSFIHKCDLFSTKVGFRYCQEAEYSTLTGGIASLLIILLFIGIFTNTGLKTLKKDYIETSSFKKVYESPKYLQLKPEQSFFFAMGLTGVDMNSGVKYFDVVMSFRNYTPSGRIKQKVDLVPCEKQVWESFQNKDLGSAYQALELQKWLCPSKDTIFQFAGKYTSQHFQFIKIGVQKCTEELNSTRRCATEQQLKNFISRYEEFVFNFYLVNTIVNPSQKEFIGNYLEDKNYFPFNLKKGLNANIFIASYEVETDQSLLPTQQLKIRTGGIINQNAQVFPYQVQQDEYLKVYLRKSNEQLFYKRSFRKIDDTLSYIGGLFSTFMSFLIVLYFYSQFSYQLEIAKNIFGPQTETDNKNVKIGHQSGEKTQSFNFLDYIIYLCLDFLKDLGLNFCFSDKFKKLENILEESRKQLDISLVFKKFLLNQRLAKALLTYEQLQGLYLQKPNSLSEAKLLRRKLQLQHQKTQMLQQKREQALFNSNRIQQNRQFQQPQLDNRNKNINFKNQIICTSQIGNSPDSFINKDPFSMYLGKDTQLESHQQIFGSGRGQIQQVQDVLNIKDILQKLSSDKNNQISQKIYSEISKALVLRDKSQESDSQNIQHKEDNQFQLIKPPKLVTCKVSLPKTRQRNGQNYIPKGRLPKLKNVKDIIIDQD